MIFGESATHNDPASTGTSEAPGCPPGYPLISVVVPVCDRLPELSRCLEALRNCPECDELIVVDDQSTENVSEIATQYQAHYLRTTHRQGPAAARNLGAQHASQEILLFVDADVVVPPTTLRTIAGQFHIHSELSAVFGSYDRDPSHSDFWSLFKNLLHHYVHQTSQPKAVTFWTGCGAIRKSVFEAAGGFNALRYPDSSIEDIELGVRLKKQNRQIRLIKQLQVTHLKKWTLISVVHSDVFHRAVPWTDLILQEGSMPRDLNLTWQSRVSAALVAICVVLTSELLLRATFANGLFHILVSALLTSVLALAILNAGLYRFFWQTRGVTFAGGAMLAHWFYLLYSSGTFAFCCGAELCRRVCRASTVTSDLNPVSGSQD